MKHFLRRLIMLAAVAGVVLWVRNRIAPTGELAAVGNRPFDTEPAGTKPADASSTEHTRQDTSATPTTEDDLTRVKGIGPVYQARLASHGITSFRDLAAADTAGIAEAIDASVQQVEDWHEQASTLD